MTDTPVSHEDIENAFKPAREVADLMRDPTMKRRAEENLKVAEAYVHQDRERVKVDRPEDVPATVELRGPAVPGWPWKWTDGTAP